jgi:hypothetical protein
LFRIFKVLSSDINRNFGFVLLLQTNISPICRLSRSFPIVSNAKNSVVPAQLVVDIRAAVGLLANRKLLFGNFRVGDHTQSAGLRLSQNSESLSG